MNSLRANNPLVYRRAMAARFTGGTNRIEIGNPAVLDALDYDQTFAFSYWFKTTTSTSSYIWSRDSTPSNGAFGPQARSNGSVHLYFEDSSNGNDFRVETDTAFNDGRWHQTIIMKNAAPVVVGSFQIFVDDVEQGLNTPASSSVSSSVYQPSSIHAVGNKSASFDAGYVGALRGLAVYDAPLSAPERTALYEKGIRSHSPIDVSTSANLLWGSGFVDRTELASIADESPNGNNGTVTSEVYYTRVGTV